MAKINFFDLLFECTNGQCGCIELVDYIPYGYLYVTFGVLTRKLYLFLVVRRAHATGHAVQ